MGIKKYEIITVGSDKRVRALRSWRVQDRYVNIGDVGGIVYDEKTLSQDGACWLFRGNFGFPGARIGGDSVVDVGEATLSATGAPAVDILGSSVVVGSKLQFPSDQTAADGVTLTAADFEQGMLNYAKGANWETWKTPSARSVRLKAPIFAGGVPVTVKCAVEGYAVQAYVLDRDGLGVTATNIIETGAGVTLTVPAGQYFMLRLAKSPAADIVPADATAAAITFKGTFETKLSIIDSRVEINPAISTGTAVVKPGGFYEITSGAKYPEAVIRNSKMSIIVPASANRSYVIIGQIIGSTATLDGTSGNVTLAGIYSNIKNLTASGVLSPYEGVSTYNLIQATDCNDFAASPTVFPGLAEARTANKPFIFQGCNVPNGKFYHHAQIANTYKNIDFAKAQADLEKTIASGHSLVSSEVEGMYRIYSSAWGFSALVESHDSVKSVTLSNIVSAYGTTIYKDAYLNGLFDIAGTNVFGNSRKHDASNTQNVMAVQGIFNEIATGKTITGIVSSPTFVCIPTPFRISGAKGLKVNNMPAGLELVIFAVNANNTITRVQGSTTVNTELNGVALVDCKAFIRFKKVNGDPITPDDVKGVTITTYNGCKIVNTKATAATIAGNVRVEDNATLIDTSVTGTGYFGGNSIAQAPSALVAQLPIEGAVYMSDKAVFAPTVANATAGLSLLEMKDNAVFAGSINTAGTNYNITMADNSKFLGSHGSRSGFVMRGNSFVAAGAAVLAACRGLLIMKDDARIESGNLTAVGYITLCGKYKQTANKVWTGKRVIDSQDAPQYDNNVKTQYDF